MYSLKRSWVFTEVYFANQNELILLLLSISFLLYGSRKPGSRERKVGRHQPPCTAINCLFSFTDSLPVHAVYMKFLGPKKRETSLFFASAIKR